MKNTLFYLFLFYCSTDIFAQNKFYDGSIIHFNIYGNGEPVFVLSGGPGNNCMQEEDVAIKIGEKYQAILLEQRGTGRSMPKALDSNSINMDAYLKDILYVMDSLKIKKAKFYGHSWGAVYASAFAIIYPKKVKMLALTGVGDIRISAENDKKKVENRLAKLDSTELKRFYEISDKNWSEWTNNDRFEIAVLGVKYNTFDSTNLAWKQQKIMRGANNYTTFTLLRNDQKKQNFDLSTKLKSLKMPITIITCKEDPLAFLTDEYKHFSPRAKIKWIDHCGHFPMYEQPEKFYSMLMETLEK
ncbi:Proline iminopeptidase [Emticicia aquatica]|jgi:proline iminopeptidase|uniref:Proline iminopeptidase n=1 Tax=Emticicia aquatica TaxID=1681835 RepID=A0ABM9AVR3_9BACT|nr:alpha/beta hydrolase [Emticicia aquatica]CAH0997806.1 Proline iminopeptidase [Emticicia aquatica]